MEEEIPDWSRRPVTHPWRVGLIWLALAATGYGLFKWMEPPAPVAPTEALSRTPGVRLFYRYECGRCHTLHAVPGALGKLAPPLDHIATVAATRVNGTDAAAYIHQSLVEPDAYVVEGYLNAMPSFRRLHPGELKELTDFLLRQR
jgi:hypothetical protein